jgi:VWFA-related protein
MLDVVVTDKSDKFAPGLGQQDFTVLDNKKSRQILSFGEVGGAAEPAEVILLVDRVNISFLFAAREREEMKKFLARNGGKLDQPVSMIFLSDAGITMHTATQDGNALADALDQSDSSLRTINRSQVNGNIERFGMSLSALMSVAAYEESKPGRKILIWLSPGWPILSGPSQELTTKERQGIFKSIVAASTALRQARVALDYINPLGVAETGVAAASFYKEFLKGIRNSRQAEPGNLALQVIATQTGGRVINSDYDLPTAIANCAAEAHAWYVLSFDSPRPDGPDEYHALEMKVGKRGLTARTRTGYYAQP